MLRSTVTVGTARKAFRPARASGSPLHGVTVAGKTGSLADRAPYRDYSWFVGFAGRDGEPEIAVAAVVVNELVWHVKAPQVAHEALAAFFEGERRLDRVRTASR
jgi:cell division protein FtsI/penicillin-binding protein 2